MRKSDASCQPWRVSDTLETKRPLGRWAIRGARIALGCGNFGGIGSAPEFFGQGLSEDQALELMDAAWEFGITHFDTADAYGGGPSELSVGRWIRSPGVPPQLTTKTYNPMQAGAARGPRPGATPPPAPTHLPTPPPDPPPPLPRPTDL